MKPTKEETMKLSTKVLDKVFPNMTMEEMLLVLICNKQSKNRRYQSPFNNRFYVRIREEQLKELNILLITK